jgi:hypothetical protein
MMVTGGISSLALCETEGNWLFKGRALNLLIPGAAFTLSYYLTNQWVINEVNLLKMLQTCYCIQVHTQFSLTNLLISYFINYLLKMKRLIHAVNILHYSE